MPKPKAPVWLRESFRDGVDERESARVERSGKPYPDAWTACWLAAHDPLRRPCGGQNLGVVANLERAHMVSRQRVENAMWDALHGAVRDEGPLGGDLSACRVLDHDEVWDLILLAAWDPRNATINCEHHHRRQDHHATPSLIIPYSALPSHVVQFAFDWGLEQQLDKFPSSI